MSSATDLVVEQIEAEGGLRLIRLCSEELSLKAPDLIGRCQVHHQSPSTSTIFQKRTRSQGPFLRRRYPTSTLPYCPVQAPAVTTAMNAMLRPLPSSGTGLPL